MFRSLGRRFWRRLASRAQVELWKLRCQGLVPPQRLMELEIPNHCSARLPLLCGYLICPECTMHRAYLESERYIGRRRFSRPGSGVAKVEQQFSRAAAALEERFDDVFRPHAVSRPRPLPPFRRPMMRALFQPRMRMKSCRYCGRGVVFPVKRGRLPKGRLGRILIHQRRSGRFRVAHRDAASASTISS